MVKEHLVCFVNCQNVGFDETKKLVQDLVKKFVSIAFQDNSAVDDHEQDTLAISESAPTSQKYMNDAFITETAVSLMVYLAKTLAFLPYSNESSILQVCHDLNNFCALLCYIAMLA